mmetsp:Transcript_59009/g.109053  ORF Transcript_59009/g.109053 Transcript_59009/m.109053 type:complete len:147 (+) Transcript_59009:65-505(+)
MSRWQQQEKQHWPQRRHNWAAPRGWQDWSEGHDWQSHGWQWGRCQQGWQDWSEGDTWKVNKWKRGCSSWGPRKGDHQGWWECSGRQSSERHRSNHDAHRRSVLAAVKQDWMALELAAEECRRDTEIVLTAVKQDGMALELAAEECR